MITQKSRYWIAVRIDTSTSWGRHVTAGVLDFARTNRDWRVTVESLTPNLSRHHQSDYDALIVDESTLASAGSIPRVLVAREAPLTTGIESVASVSVDLDALSKSVVDHFATRGFRHLVQSFVGTTDRLGFRDASVKCLERAASGRMQLHGSILFSDQHDEATSAEYLASLPKPLAVLAWEQQVSVEVVNLARDMGIAIPSDLAILSAEDGLLCSSAYLEISGVELPGHQVGYRAAESLNAMLLGNDHLPGSATVPPAQVIARRSTNIFAVDDDDLQMALEYISINATTGIRVADVVEKVCISRRSLERRFKEQLDCTMGDEINRVRMMAAARLLRETDWAIPRVAREAGFGSPEYFSTSFRSAHGISPMKYRQSWITKDCSSI